MTLAHTLIDEYFAIRDNELYVDEIPISELVATYNTPLFIYSEQVIDQKLSLLRSALPTEFSISYSIKANPNGAFLKYFIANGCGLEVASGGELFQALHVGCPPEKILFAGPGKTEAELAYAIEANISEIHVESMLEAERISTLSQAKGVVGRIALRVNPVETAQGGAMRMGGKPAPFGIDEEEIEHLLARIIADPHLDICGIHLFTGTQILDHEILLNQYQHGLAIAKRVARQIKRPLRTLDFGGGLGIPYFAHEQALNMDALTQGLEIMMMDVRKEPLFDSTQFMVEPGRFLVGDSGIYVARVNDIKVSRGKKFLVTDGGMHHHLAASGNLGQTIKRNYPLAILNKLRLSDVEQNGEKVDVVGPLCTPLDTVGRSVLLPKAEVGDLIGIFQSGAYGRTSSPLGFLSHPTPPEVWVARGKDSLVQPRGKYEDYTLI